VKGFLLFNCSIYFSLKYEQTEPGDEGFEDWCKANAIFAEFISLG
jgi:hypothetical protein